MNRGNRRAGEHRALEPCALCGMYSGERMEDAAPPFDFAVVCASCGARTRPYHGLNCATKAWNRGDVYRPEKEPRPDCFFERFRKVGCPYCGSQYFNELDEEGEDE